MSDTQCGFGAYGPAAIRSIANDEGMRASTDIFHHARHHDYRIAEIATTVSSDVDNASTQNSVMHGLTLVQNILKTIERERPLTPLGAPGFLITPFGFFLGHWSIANYASNEAVGLDVATVAIVRSLLGILFCFTALILHSLTVHLSTAEVG